MKLEIRGVLAGAYRGRSVSARALLTHAVLIDDEDHEVRLLCRRVPLDHMCDEVVSGPPSCEVCRKRAEKFERPNETEEMK